MIKLTFDFETQSRANLKQIGAFEYSMDPSTIALCLSFKVNNSPKIFLFDYHQMQKHWRDFPAKFKDNWTRCILTPDLVFSAHNSFFENVIYHNVLVKRFGWPPIPLKKFRCTATKAAAVAIPRNLQDAGAVMQTAIQKDFEGHRVMMKLCRPTKAFVAWQKAYDKLEAKDQLETEDADALRDSEPAEFWTPETAPEDFKTLYKYCESDVLAEEKLDEALPDLTPKEQALWFLDQRINLRGVQVDAPLVDKISRIMAAEGKRMHHELDALTMGLVSSGNARAAILDFMSLEGIEMPNLKAATVDEFLENRFITEDAEKLLKIRKALAKASTAKYKKFQGVARSDGRARDLFLFNAASTGRWGGKNIQPQNFPRGVLKDMHLAIEEINNLDVDDLKLLYGANLMPLFSSCLRGMFIATKGFDLFVEDLNAIECRVLWWLAGHKKGLKIFQDDKDPYKEMAAKIYHKSVLEITDAQRQVGKAATLGCGYQMGGRKFVSAAWDTYRAEVDKGMAKVAVAAYRELHYPVTELWDNYQNAAISAIENPGRKYRVGSIGFYVAHSFLWIELPSGRSLAYKDPTVGQEKTVVMIDREGENIYASNAAMYADALSNGFKKASEFYSPRIRYWATNHKAKKIDCTIPKWTRESTYGGKLAENITQAVSRDVLAEAMIRAHKAGFNIVMHSHDEMVSEAPKGKFKIVADEKGVLYCPEYRAIMEHAPEWAKDLPLKSGGWVDTRYKK